LCGTTLTVAPAMWGPVHLWCSECQLPFAKERVLKLARAERPFAVGDRVLVHGPPGEVIGDVLEAATPYEMPDLGQGARAHEAHQIMHEWRIDFMLFIAHKHDDNEVMFVALRHPGGWRDLRGQDLRIAKVRKDQ